MIEYFILMGVLLMMFLLAFLPGYLEYRAPRDSGPLRIDLSRPIEPRSEALRFRKTIDSFLKDQEWKQKSLWGQSVYERESKTEHSSLKILRTDGNMAIPAGSVVESALIVLGDLVSGENCKFNGLVYVKGRCQIGRHNELAGLTSVGDLSVGEESKILGFVDSDGVVRIGAGSIILGPVSSGRTVTLGGSCDVRRLSSHAIEIASRSSS